MGRLIQETNPETGNNTPGTTNYTYDSDSSGVCAGIYNGDLVKKVDNRGNVTCYTYDSLHRVQTIAYSSGSPDYTNSAPKTFVYDAATYNSTAMANAKGQLAEAYTGPSGSKTTDEFFSYSLRSELTDVYEHTPNSGTAYYHSNATYWANGVVNTLALVSPANVLPSQTFGVEGEGRPSSVTANSSQNPTVVSGTNYNLSAYQTTVTFGSGDSDVYSADANTGRLLRYRFNVGSNHMLGTLTWNSNGSLKYLAIADTIPTTTDAQTCQYGHDDMARIASVSCGNTIWRQAFSYDPFGNISKDSTGYTGLTFNAFYQTTTNQFTTIGSITPTYDTDGRLTYDGVNHYTWEANSMLHTIDTSPSTTVTYDALGRMVEKAVGTTYTQIVYGPLGPKLAVMSGQTLQKGFIPLPAGGMAIYTSSGLGYYRHTDHLGSSRLATTPNQTLYSSTAYAPYGEPYAQVGTTDLSYTGQDQDTVTGMHDFLVRRYTPTSGRWLSPDPAGLGAVDPSNPQTWNRYAYVRNSPLNLIDPFGEDEYEGCSNATPWCYFSQNAGILIGGWGDPFQTMDLGSYSITWQTGTQSMAFYFPATDTIDEYDVPTYATVTAFTIWDGGDGSQRAANNGTPHHLLANSDCLLANGIRSIDYQLQDASNNNLTGYNVTEFLVYRQTGSPYTGGTTGSPTDTQKPNPQSGYSGFTDGLGGFGFRDILQTFTASQPGGPSIPIFVRDIDDQDWGTNGIWGGGGSPIYVNGKTSPQTCH